MGRLPDDSLRSRRQRRLAAEVERAALRLFAERGFRDVTVEDIAAATDISPRTFFRYFPSKEDVVLAQRRRRADQLRDALADRPPHEPAITALRTALLSVAPRDEDERELMILLFKVLSEAPEIAAQDVGHHMSSKGPLIAMIAVRLGADPTTDLRPRVIVGSMLAATGEAFRMWLERDCEGDISALLAQALDLLEQGFEVVDGRVHA